MTALSQIARCNDSVKAHMVSLFEERLGTLLDGSDKLAGRALELAVWDVLTEVGREMLSSVLAKACWSATVEDVAQKPNIRLRLDRDYWLTQTTTLGVVQVPLFAYREAGGKVRYPAKKKVFSLHSTLR